MFAALGTLAVQHKKAMLFVSLIFAVLTAIVGVGGLDRLSYGGELQSDAESIQATDAIRDHIGHGGADIVISYRSSEKQVDDPVFRAEVEQSLARAPTGLVTGILSYWGSGLSVLNSQDQHATVVAVMLSGANDTERTKNYRELRSTMRADGYQLSFSGPIAIREAVTSKAQSEMLRTELLSLPAVFLLLVLLFRSLMAALLPVAIGALTLSVTLGLLRPLTEVMDVSILAINAVTVLCLAFAVDAALFVVSRFREELTRRDSVDEAVIATVATAGRTCFFSGLTIGLVVLGLLLFPTGLTRSIGISTAIAMMVGTVLSVTLLPALLSVLGHRVNWGQLPIPKWLRVSGVGNRLWGRIGRAVIAEPVGYLVAAVAVLAVLTVPFFHVTLGFPDQRTLPAGETTRVAAEEQRQDFIFPALDLIQVVTSFAEPVESPAGQGAVREWTQQLLRIPGVQGGQSVASADHHTVLYLYAGPAESDRSLEIVRIIRELAPPAGGAVLVGGASAMTVDIFDLLAERLPWVLLFIAVVAFLLLGITLKSVLLPLKALVVNALSLGASFGALTWIFQDGHLTWLVGADPTGYLDVLQPFLLLVILIGLSMDYEFFLLSRIREEYDRTGDTNAAVVSGLQRSGPVFTGAALVVMVVAAVFATTEVILVKQLCIGIFVAVLVDATLIRAVVVPATIRLLGRANWWFPSFHRSHSTEAPLPLAREEVTSSL